MTEGKIGGIYRGQNWRYNYPKYVAKSSSVNNRLKWRGIAYLR
ncbi:MAG: DUF4278 domain-containing protein [Moorea sp. SIOASIH]|nr:DUF4278 domain-containing protein [Moorena sp. SIOASIH]NEO40326.1 DUF4278 domain-containing protein [Moorena sp. SIOASIH]